jgi:hypothetical protein
LDAPPVAPATLPSLHELPVLSTKADVDITNTSCYAGRVMELKSNAYREQDTRETWGQGDRYSEMQEFNQPNIDSSLVGFENEMFFECPDVDGSRLVNWYNNKDVNILNKKRRTTKITWIKYCLSKGEKTEIVETLFKLQ